MAELSQLRPPRGSRKKPMRVGRGIGARKGKTSGRGNKGQLSRTGVTRRPGFEGGQMPLHRRIPKRGFHSKCRAGETRSDAVRLHESSCWGSCRWPSLRERGLAKGRRPVKILGEGALSVKLTVAAHAFSASARQKIEKAGGTVEVLPQRPAAAAGSGAGA